MHLPFDAEAQKLQTRQAIVPQATRDRISGCHIKSRSAALLDRDDHQGLSQHASIDVASDLKFAGRPRSYRS